jgi:hypothetical protein
MISFIRCWNCKQFCNKISNNWGKNDVKLEIKHWWRMDASYENYSLLQLISIMEGSEYSRKCPWNKQAIIEFIEKENLNIPKKIKEMEPTKWHHYSTTRYEGVLVTPTCKFYDGCAIQLQDGSMWDIEVHEALSGEDVVVCVDLIGESEEDNKHMRGEEFIHMLDHENITLLQVRDLHYYVSPEQEEYWTNYDALT